MAAGRDRREDDYSVRISCASLSIPLVYGLILLVLFSDFYFSPITGEAALQKEEGSLLFYYLIFKRVHF